MSSTTMSGYRLPTVDVTERSDQHFLPFIVAVMLFVVTTIAAVAIVGLPQ